MIVVVRGVCHSCCTWLPLFYALQSPELLARLERLQDELETREYNEIVKDVDRTAGGMRDPFMATFKQQAAFGEMHAAGFSGRLLVS